MKTTVNKDNLIQLEEVYIPIVLKTKDGEEIIISMRDSGFEFSYQGEMYFAKEGYLESFEQKVVRGLIFSITEREEELAKQEALSKNVHINPTEYDKGFILGWRLCWEWMQ